MKTRKPNVEELARAPYPMRVYQDDDSGDWVAEVSDLPGCVGVGKTAEKAVAIAKRFIPEWIAEAVAQGWSVPQPTRKEEASGRFVVRLPRSLHSRLQDLAEVEGTSLNQLVVAMLSERATARELVARIESIVGPLQDANGSCPSTPSGTRRYRRGRKAAQPGSSPASRRGPNRNAASRP